MLELTDEEKKRIEELATAHYGTHDMWQRKELPRTIESVLSWFTGEKEIYDTSLMDELNLRPQVEGKRILNIGDCGLSSSLDFIASGSELVYAVDVSFFGSWVWDAKELDALVAMKAAKRGVNDVSNLKAVERFIGGSNDQPLPQKFDAAYFFFPPPAKFATLPERYSCKTTKDNFTEILAFAYGHLERDGSFKIVTEVEPQYLDDIQFPGFERSVWRKDGRPLYTMEQLKSTSDFERVRPASSLGLSVISYAKL